MTVRTPRADLETAHLIGLIGATTVDVDELLAASTAMWKRGVGALILLSDELRLPTSTAAAAEVQLDRINTHLHDHEQTLSIYAPSIEQAADVPLAEDGVRWIRSNLGALPPALRTTLRTRAVMTLQTGDNPGTSPGMRGVCVDARPVPAEVASSEPQKLSILIDNGKENSARPPATNIAEDEAIGTGDSEAGQTVQTIHPKIPLGGHASAAVRDAAIPTADSEMSSTRVVRLSGQDPAELAILQVRTLKLTIVDRADDTVTELTGDERGTWIVQTESGTKYVFDFGKPSVTRHPGPGAATTINDTTRRLRHIESCRVGHSGAWTMNAGGGYADPVDFYWAVCTEIRTITRVADASGA
ncbi:hypothetical protein OH146_12185 [Salinibacterium sp. SYSU T00001]|uniref:hypothetical protein n=1 Tax=Homoserinimonas sedimenticola TaxID=2986805 RepID=UPI002236387D|nr:hypothetical protein [Salinibacterium sedimenticola]MCW4386532.1 hypothetical protein [Salinibacterium sedimenticola]